ncbi:MAG: chromosome segregation protein SMC [Defluviitaleaceae bacterium]|nr:chromosome segregation protein SMC [Defluviitaleaceae bacterium]
MFLKRLELAGFKSFPDKIKLDFPAGITAVVGPNGSGKSNIGDAVRWVMGEQSARSLRGAKMEDIIFAGTEHRRPLGYAEVHMLIDNSQGLLPVAFNEVTVTRRVYRSGESEYLINGSACRMKDIHRLFMDTGVGREGYSIIGQGRVDEILSTRSEDRRHLFEEAAGIVKYKTRRHEAHLKLEAEKQNLARVEDLIEELQTQIEPMTQQAEQAKAYLNLREQYKTIHVNLFLQEAAAAEEQEKKAKETLLNLTNQSEDEKKRLKQAQESITALKEEEAQAEFDYKQANRQIILQVTEIEKAESNLKLVDRIAKDIEQRTVAMSQKQREREEEEEIWEELQEALEEAQDNLEKKEAAYNALEATQKEQESALEDSQHAAYAYKEDELKQKITEFTKFQTQLSTAGDALRAKALTVQQELHAASSRRKLLSEMERDREGYYSSVKVVLLKKEQDAAFGNGIFGPAGELINVPKAYENAISVALAGATQNILTATEADAQRAIAYLKSSQTGRATFLPVSAMKARHINAEMDKLLQEDGVIGLASNLISFDQKYSPVFGYLLGNVFVVNHLTRAIELSKKYRQSYRLVTLDGDLISPGGAMSGGSQGRQSTDLVGRSRQISELQDQITALQDQARQLEQSQKEQTINQQAIANKITQLQQALQALAIEKVQKSQELYKQQQADSLKQREEAMAQLTDQKVQISKLTQNLQAAQDNTARVVKEWEAIRSERVALEAEMTDFRNTADSLASLRFQLEAEKAQLSATEERSAALRAAITEAESKQREHMENLARISQEAARLEARHEQIEAESRRLHNEIWDAYGLTFQSAQTFNNPDYTISFLRREERHLKTEIAGLGAVNVGAIDAYQALRQRYDFLTEQRDDIFKAEEQLQEVIQALTVQMEQQFSEQFSLIAKHFSDVFKEMFGGGNASLAMSDPDRVLESGIEITAQPPGKKLQTLSLLSGGERALTAIALLFGILRMKPSPFCLLDEIEAALDDANVLRFAQFLKVHAGDTQFIVITHRKGTMEYADTLYGVTMQEMGISKMVSVDFR